MCQHDYELKNIYFYCVSLHMVKNYLHAIKLIHNTPFCSNPYFNWD